MDSFCKHIFPLINMYKTIGPVADLVGVCRGAHPPQPKIIYLISNTQGVVTQSPEPTAHVKSDWQLKTKN